MKASVNELGKCECHNPYTHTCKHVNKVIILLTLWLTLTALLENPHQSSRFDRHVGKQTNYKGQEAIRLTDF